MEPSDAWNADRVQRWKRDDHRANDNLVAQIGVLISANPMMQ